MDENKSCGPSLTAKDSNPPIFEYQKDEPTINLLDPAEPPLPGFFMEDAPDNPPDSVFDANVLNKAAQKKFEEHHPPLEGFSRISLVPFEGKVQQPFATATRECCLSDFCQITPWAERNKFPLL